MEFDVSHLLKEDGKALFERAQKIAKDMESRFRWPIFFNTNCIVEPRCHHCFWYGSRYFDTNWAKRYSLDEVVKKAVELEKAGIKKTHAVSGWMGYEVPEYYYDYISAIKANTHLELYGQFGPLSKECLIRLKASGMDGYWTGIEVMNEKTFKNLRPGDSLESRLKTLRDTKELGLGVWSSFLMGVGETDDDIARTIELLQELGIDSLMVIPLKPVPFTEMEQAELPNQYRVAKAMAAARIAFGDQVNIMSFTGMSYLEWGIRAGANEFETSYPWEMAKINQMRRMFYASGAH
ncbi:MAG: radical SAM protein [Chloroflexota bacterium]